MERGLRQGDPISSFLFVMVAESLSYVIKEARTKGLILGLPIGKNKIEVTHLQFADDTLIFLPKDEEVVTNYNGLLRCFSLMTGLSINYSKSSIISWLKEDDRIKEMSQILNCSTSALPVNYSKFSHW